QRRQTSRFFRSKKRSMVERLLGLLIAGEWLRPEGQPRELFAYHPQLVLGLGFVEPVDHPDQRADMLLGQLKELFASLGLHQTSCSRTATVGHDQPSLRAETKATLRPAARFLFFWGRNRDFEERGESGETCELLHTSRVAKKNAGCPKKSAISNPRAGAGQLSR